MRHLINILVLVLFLALVPGVTEALEVTAKVDKEEINVGDRVILSVNIEKAAGYEVLFPETPDNPGEFSFIESHSFKNKWKKEYVFTIYDVGTRVIPPIKIQYKGLKQDEWLVLESQQMPIEVKSLLTDTDMDIRDIKGLVDVRMNRILPVIIFFALIVIIAVGWIFWRNRLKQKVLERDVVKKSAYEIAYEELDVLKKKDLPGKGFIKEYYTGLSDIMRHYIENRFCLRAPEMTTEEFLIAVKVSSEMTREHKGLLREFLSCCDMVKFAKYGPTPLEIIDSLCSVERFLDQTRIVEQEEPEKK